MEKNLDGSKQESLGTRIWTVLRGYFVVTGIMTTVFFLLIFLALGSLGTFSSSGGKQAQGGALPERMVLAYDFGDNELGEVPGPPSFGQPLLSRQVTLRDMTESIVAAASDDRVKGLIARVDGAGLSLAQVQELRAALKTFRESGKFAWGFAESFQGGMGAYYLASAFGELWLQPVGVVGITGLSAEMPFAKGLMDKVGVNPEFVHKGAYKSYPEMFTRSDMSPENREMMASLLGDLSRQIEEGIAADRNIGRGTLRSLIDKAPLTEKEALEAKLVDKAGYADELRDTALAEAGVDDDGLVNIGRYIEARTPKFKSRHGKDKKKIALVYGVGDVVSGDDSNPGSMAADRVAEAFRSAREDEDVAAVVFRIDSPGGSPEAAETIHHAVEMTKREGLPVIVSMGGVAASGGYWAAAGADKIVADPGTLTGSIGVFGGKMDLSALFGKIGLAWDGVKEGENAGMWSPSRPFSKAERARFDAMLDVVYDTFIVRVSEGRGMDPKKVEQVAQGRVWTGAQAKENGLVDTLGGLDEAIRLAREAAKLDDAAAVEEFPPRKTGIETLFSILSGDESVSMQPLGTTLEEMLRAEVRRQTAILRAPVPQLR